MYLVHRKKENVISHILKPEYAEMDFDFIREKGDTVCMLISGMRDGESKLIGQKRWSIQFEKSGKVCENCKKMTV